MSAGRNPYALVDGWPINIANPAQAIAEICASGERSESFAAFTLNLDHLVKLRVDRAFSQAYRSARYVTADGAPVAFLAARAGTGVIKTTGADLVQPLARAAAERGLPIYLFGTTPEALAGAERELQLGAGNRLRVAGAVAPPFGFDPEGPVADAELDRIATSGAKLCFVALSPPKGELFAARGVARGVPIGFISIGAALDFLAGRQRRAPKLIQDVGMEWFWRLATNPKRFTARYARCALLLADIAGRTVLHGNARTPPRT